MDSKAPDAERRAAQVALLWARETLRDQGLQEEMVDAIMEAETRHTEDPIMEMFQEFPLLFEDRPYRRDTR